MASVAGEGSRAYTNSKMSKRTNARLQFQVHRAHGGVDDKSCRPAQRGCWSYACAFTRRRVTTTSVAGEGSRAYTNSKMSKSTKPSTAIPRSSSTWWPRRQNMQGGTRGRLSDEDMERRWGMKYQGHFHA